jgi:hypothetical protein
MYKIANAIEYNGQNGSWEFTFPKSFKDVHSQGGLKVIIDPGYPTGYNGNLWEAKENGLSNPSVIIKGYDNVSGWVSTVSFPLPQLLEALIKLIPNVETKTMVLALNDLKLKEDEDEK